MTGDGRPAVLAQVVFADVRAPGPTTRSIGWKVTEVVTAPGATAPDDDLLVAVDGVGQAYSPDVELAATGRSAEVPSVLKQVRLRDDVMLLASFADAGLDRTGRASHVVHGIVHEGALVDPGGRPLRPVELLDSDLWVRPIGETEVAATSLADVPFAPTRGPLDLDALVGDAFLTDLDHAVRVELLPAVLAGFAEALASDRHLLLAAADRDEIVGWLGLLQGLLDPESAGRLRFSVREELRSAAAVERFDLQVAGVVVPPPAAGSAPDSRLAELGDRFLVLDTAAPPPHDDAGGWTLAVGGPLRRSTWADLAEAVLRSPLTAGDVRESLDHLAEVAAGPVAAAPLWALPVAVLLSGVPVDRPAEQLRELLRAWPPPTAGPVDPRVVSAVRDLYEQETAADPALAGSLVFDLAPGVPEEFVRGPMLAWFRTALSEPGAPRGERPPGRALAGGDAEQLALELPGRTAWLPGAPPVQQVPAATRVWRLASAAGVPDAAVAAALAPVVDPVLAVLVDPAFDPFAAGWPPASPVLWQALRPALEAALDAGAPAPSPATQAWTAPVLGDEDRPEVVAAGRWPVPLTRYGAVLAAAVPPGVGPESLTALTVLARAAESGRRRRVDGAQLLLAALDDVVGPGEPVPLGVAEYLRAGADPELLVTLTAEVLGRIGPDPAVAAFARPAFDLLRRGPGPGSRPGAAVLATAALWPALVTGDARAAEAMLAEVDEVFVLVDRAGLPPRWRDPTATALRAWALRLGPTALHDPPPTAGASPGLTVSGWFERLGATPDQLLAAWDLLTAHHDAQHTVLLLAGVVVRAAVADTTEGAAAAEPFAAALAGDPDGPAGGSGFVRAAVDAWVHAAGGTTELHATVQEVLGDLAGSGWAEADVAALAEHAEAVVAPSGRGRWRAVTRGGRK